MRIEGRAIVSVVIARLFRPKQSTLGTLDFAGISNEFQLVLSFSVNAAYIALPKFASSCALDLIITVAGQDQSVTESVAGQFDFLIV